MFFVTAHTSTFISYLLFNGPLVYSGFSTYCNYNSINYITNQQHCISLCNELPYLVNRGVNIKVVAIILYYGITTEQTHNIFITFDKSYILVITKKISITFCRCN